MEGHATRVCEACGTLYPPEVEWCPVDGEPTVAAMIVRASPSGRHAPQPPTRLAQNFRPSFSSHPALPERFARQEHLPANNFVPDEYPEEEEPELPQEEATSVRIMVPPQKQPRAVFSENKALLQAPVVTALRDMQSFPPDEYEDTASRYPQQAPQFPDDDPPTSARLPQDPAQYNGAKAGPRAPQKAPTPPPAAKPNSTVPEIEALPPKPARPRTSKPTEAIPIAAAAAPKSDDSEEGGATRLASKKTAPPDAASKKAAPVEERPSVKVNTGLAEAARASLGMPPTEAKDESPPKPPSLALAAIPLATPEAPPKDPLFSRVKEWFSEFFSNLKESALLRLLLLAAFIGLLVVGVFSLGALLDGGEVRVRLLSTPEGARVSGNINGEPFLTTATPSELTVPKGAKVKVVFEQPGFTPRTEEYVAEEDREISVSLQPAPKKE